MYKFKGSAGGSRTAVGYVKKYVPAGGEITDDSAGILYYEKAKERALEKLDALYEKALNNAGADGAQIFMAQKMLLEDEGFDRKIRDLLITQHFGFMQAVEKVCNDTAELLINSGDELIASRADDIFGLRNLLTGVGAMEVDLSGTDTVLCAETLTAAELMELETGGITGIVCEKGSALSHVAILAADMGIAAVMGVGEGFLAAVSNGMRTVLDEARGDVIIGIDEETAAGYFKSTAGSVVSKYKEAGIKLYANIDSADDASVAVKCGAEGVGLFRSEYLYLGRTAAPDEEEQFAEYKKAAGLTAPKPLVIRTADLGGDKLPAYMEDKGLRGLSYSLAEKEIFRTQLKAVYRAAKYGNIKLMFPMVSNAAELGEALAICREIRAGINSEAELPSGIMAETREAAENSAELAQIADFISIGTNDLYHEISGAAGRDSEIPDDEQIRENVTKLIEKTVKSAHEQGKRVTVCGRMAEDSDMAERFIEMGVDGVSLPVALIKERT